MARDLNMDLVDESLNPESRAAVNAVLPKLNQWIDTEIDGFRAECEKNRQELSVGRYPEALASELKTIRQSLDTDVMQLAKIAADVKTAAEKLEEASHSTNTASSALAAKSAALGERAEALTRRLEDFRAKVNAFGDKSGHAIASAAWKAFTGVL